MDWQTCDTIYINMNQEERIIRVLERVANGLDNIKTEVINATSSINSALGSINSCVSGLSEEIKDVVIQMKQAKQSQSNSFGELQPTSTLSALHAGSSTSLVHNYQGTVQNFTSSKYQGNLIQIKGNSTLKEEKMGGLLKKQPIQRNNPLSEFQRERVAIEAKNQHRPKKADLPSNIITKTNANKPKKPAQKRSNQLIQKLSGSSSQSCERESEQSISNLLNCFIQNCYIIVKEIVSEDQSFDQKQTKLENIKKMVESKQKEQSKEKHVLEVLRLEIICAKLRLDLAKIEMKG